MATKTAPTTKIDPPIGVAFDANTGKAVTLGMDVYPAGWTVYEANAQWHLGYLGDLSNVWRDYTGKGVSVGVYDQGVESAHWDLAANIDKSKELVDDNGNVLSGEPVFTSDDLHDGAHGTSCAGLIAAARNGRGGVGVAYDAKITSVNIFDGNSQASDLNWVIGKGSGFDVISNSWGFSPFVITSGWSRGAPDGWDSLTSQVSDIARDGRNGLGTIFVKAAGNDFTENVTDGLNLDRHVVTVGAYRQVDGAASYYSNSGPSLLISAPSNDYKQLGGTGMVTTDLMGVRGYNTAVNPEAPADYTDDFGGTSAATPVVSGVVALMLEANSDLGWRDVRNILAASAKMPVAFDTGPVVYTIPLETGPRTVALNESQWKLAGHDANWNGGAMHYSNDYGYGGVDAYAATRLAEVWSLFGEAKTSANEVHASVATDVGMTAISGMDNASPNRLQQYNGFVNTPTSFQFEVSDKINLEHIDLTLDFKNFLYGMIDGEIVTEAYQAWVNNTQFKLIAPDGTEAFSVMNNPMGLAVSDEGTVFMLGFNGFQNAQSEGTWTLQFGTWSQDNGVYDGKHAVYAEQVTVNSLKMDLYGSTPSNDDVYTYTNEFFTMAAISGEKGRTKLADDNGGTDWINAAAVSKDVTLSLVAGQSTYFGGQKAFTIDRTSVIENAITGDGNDTLTGNRSDNILYGMRGNDVLNGGAGNDTLYGGTGSNRFVFDSKGTSGKDIVGDWMMGDIIATQKALKGVGSDGTITVGADATLLLDGSAKGDTVLLSGLTGAKLQEMGLRDGYYWYAYVSAAAADAGKVVQEAAYHPGAVAAGAVSEIVAANDASASLSGTGLGAEGAHATIGELDHGFYLYDAMAGSMQGGVQLFA